jgi:hypothetical protein
MKCAGYAKASLLLFGALLLNSFLVAPGYSLSKDDDIDTNRPSFMDSPLVVPKGSLQFENGSLYSRFQHNTHSYDAPETEVRLGLLKHTEFQMFTPNWVLSQGKGALRGGVADLGEAGIKQEIPNPIKGLNLAFIGGVNIPTGRSSISTSGPGMVLRAPWTKALTKNWSAGGMQSILLLNNGRNLQWQNFNLLCRSFGPRTSAFVEYAGFYTQDNFPTNLIHFGVVRKLNKNTQADIHFGFGLNKAAPAAFVGGGFSFRLDRLPLVQSL